MKYLNHADIKKLGVNWRTTVDLLKEATWQLKSKDFSQPIKLYLRYGDMRNRIIAMPAYIGGARASAGLKWIASFPDNIKNGIDRAHSILILNEVDTGIPKALFNTSLISCIRTASVSGAVIDQYFKSHKNEPSKMCFGIIGFGPVGQQHLEMIFNLFGEKIDRVFIFDLIPIHGVIDKLTGKDDKIIIATRWEEVFDQSDILITCTVAAERYINKKPRKGTLHLNVSLRDYHASFKENVEIMAVDNWEEVCRENTDIEIMHKEYSLQSEDVLDIVDVLCDEKLPDPSDKVMMFNPMGMAIYDIAIGRYFLDLSDRENVGVEMAD
jgi:2,3-diaminopropionate biosynthesis protein SbnB